MFDFPQLFEPVLEHNRRESKALFVRMLQAGLVALVVLVPIAILTPTDRAGFAITFWMGGFIIVIGYLEAKRIAIFRRDLREQRQVEREAPQSRSPREP